jgi:hypothetical protein
MRGRGESGAGAGTGAGRLTAAHRLEIAARCRYQGTTPCPKYEMARKVSACAKSAEPSAHAITTCPRSVAVRTT